MTRIVTPFHAIAATVGGGLIGTDLLSNTEWMLAQTKTLLDSNILAVIMVGIGGLLALSASIQAFRQRHLIVGLMLVLGYVTAVAFSLGATLERVASQRDAHMITVFGKDAVWRRLDEAHDRASKAAAVECSTGRGRMCEAIEAQVAKVEERKRFREAELDSSGKRLAYYLYYTGLTAEHVSMWQPALLPVALLILGQWLFAFGINGQRAPEFNVVDEAAEQLERAERFVSQYRATYHRRPSVAQVVKAAGIGKARARKILAAA